VLETLGNCLGSFEVTRKSRGVDARSSLSAVVWEQTNPECPGVWHLAFSECQLFRALQTKRELILLFSTIP